VLFVIKITKENTIQALTITENILSRLLMTNVPEDYMLWRDKVLLNTAALSRSFFFRLAKLD
jgi:hypothetical protein